MIPIKHFLLALIATAPAAAAQCFPVAGTGCPGIPPLKICNNNPSIGGLFCMTVLPCPACTPILPHQFNIWFLGPPAILPVTLPTCCPVPTCGLYSPTIHQITLRPGPVECYPIPNNTALIGGIIAFQPVCLDLFFGCYDLAPAMMVKIR